jgi:hypothetical protein
VNLVPPAERATWFYLVDVPLNNGTETYPKGDNIQVAEPWRPPETWADIDTSLANRILDAIDAGLVGEAGLPTGERYCHTGPADERAAWKVVQRFTSGKSDKQCKAIIKQWIENGVLRADKYNSAKDRKERTGLTAVASKRPGGRIEN